MSVAIRMIGVGIGAAALTMGVAGPVQAQSGIIGPSAFTLTVGEGEAIGTAANQRTVWLVCAPTVFGTHPKSGQACGELAEAAGNFDKLKGRGTRFCPFVYRPITVSAQGVWNGTKVSWQHKYANSCERENTDSFVFDF
ncbi:subtilase-type protease inhibitor [Nocardia panacis]|nr:subtilase-type protease inhibitor [Nocardia panacis]